VDAQREALPGNGDLAAQFIEVESSRKDMGEGGSDR